MEPPSFHLPSNQKSAADKPNSERKWLYTRYKKLPLSPLVMSQRHETPPSSSLLYARQCRLTGRTEDGGDLGVIDAICAGTIAN